MSEANDSLPPKQRREYILTQLHAQGRLEVARLATELGIAEETVRRDFRRLEGEGKLRRAHGGALPLESEIQSVEDLGKPRITPTPLSGAAAAMLPEAGWVFLDGGVDIEGAAGLISEGARLSVVAGSVGCSLSASSRSSVSVVSLGGEAEGVRGIYRGAWALENLRRYFFDLCFLEVQGIAGSGELLTADTSEAAVRRRVLERSARRVGVWNGEQSAAARVAFGGLDDLDALIVPWNAELDELGDVELPALVHAEPGESQSYSAV